MAATVTLAGTVTKELLLLRPTEIELVAELFSDTVQVLLALLPNVDGAHESPVKVAGALALRVND